jgi:ankyrin repeat protein
MQIHYAAKHGDRAAVQRQLSRGVSIDARSEASFGCGGKTPLMWAIQSPEADVEFLRFLVTQGADVNALSAEGSTPLMEAVRAGDAAKVRFLLDSGADASFRNSNGYAALITGTPALPEITQMLIEAGAETDGETPWSESALSVAARDSDWDTVRHLLDAGADPAPLEWTPLIRAVVLGSLDEVTAELDAGGDFNAQDRWERTPWLHAVCSGDIAKAGLLLERGSDPNACGRGGDTALMYAASLDDAPMTGWLLSLGLDVRVTTPFGDTALHVAAEHGAVHVIPLLLAAGADVAAENSVSTQPIDGAVNIETVRLLTAAGADIDFINGQGDWLLKSAAEAGDIEVVRDLLAMGATVDNTRTGETALHAAVKEDQRAIMRLLLDAGADPDAQNGDSWGLLWYARTTEAAQILLDAGVDVHLTDEMGQEAVAKQEDVEIQALLIASGGSINPPDSPMGTPLTEAVGRSNVAQIRFLLDAGADVNAAPHWGQTPLMEAAENSFAEGVRILLDAGADTDARDEQGRTALHHAAAPEAFTAYQLAQQTNSPEWRAKMSGNLPEDIREFLETEEIEPELSGLSQYGYVESDSVDCLDLLAQTGADIDAPDTAGMTPLMLAASCGRPARVAGLLALGADVTRCDTEGRTALDHAATHPREDQREAIAAMLTDRLQTSG